MNIFGEKILIILEKIHYKSTVCFSFYILINLRYIYCSELGEDDRKTMDGNSSAILQKLQTDNKQLMELVQAGLQPLNMALMVQARLATVKNSINGPG